MNGARGSIHLCKRRSTNFLTRAFKVLNIRIFLLPYIKQPILRDGKRSYIALRIKVKN